MENVLPKYRIANGTQEQLREAWKTFKDPQPITETFVAPDGTTHSRVLTDVLHPDALSFWKIATLPPLPTIGGNGVVHVFESPSDSEPQPTPSGELKDSVNDTA